MEFFFQQDWSKEAKILKPKYSDFKLQASFKRTSDAV